MDTLDDQLTKLQMLTNTESSSGKHQYSSKSLTRRVGPAVPPKPKKHSSPQLNSDLSDDSYDTSYPPPPLPPLLITKMHQVTSSYPHVYENVSQANTLDDSLLLQQKLDALEHTNILDSQRKLKEQQEKFYHDITIEQQMAPGSGFNDRSLYANQKIFYATKPLLMDDGFQDSCTINDDGLVYSNIIHVKSTKNELNGERKSSDDFPPPPPSPSSIQQEESLDLQLRQTDDDDLPPPPSPVSSSYSELRRATDNGYQSTMAVYPIKSYYHQLQQQSLQHQMPLHHQQQQKPQQQQQQPLYSNNYQYDYNTYGPSSKNSSTYESFYEPINPRPPSEISSHSNFSLYTPFVGRQVSGGTFSNKLQGPKEAEVDVLTDLLVQSLDGSQDTDSYGICIKCGERIVGENSGCTAMDQIYHIECFTCCQCQINLQGKPFYALDGKPYCEDDYLNTLEKCCVCMKPILERILRATGKPYHPGCFCCVVCGKSLDGIPFTVDATNQIHCIEDFHKKFAPRCCVCRLPIMPEPGKEETVRVVALDRSFHISCYKCEDCGLLLSSEAEGRGCYPLDDHILCKSCNAKRVQTLTSHMSTEL